MLKDGHCLHGTAVGGGLTGGAGGKTHVARSEHGVRKNVSDPTELVDGGIRAHYLSFRRFTISRVGVKGSLSSFSHSLIISWSVCSFAV